MNYIQSNPQNKFCADQLNSNNAQYLSASENSSNRACLESNATSVALLAVPSSSSKQSGKGSTASLSTKDREPEKSVQENYYRSLQKENTDEQVHSALKEAQNEANKEAQKVIAQMKELQWELKNASHCMPTLPIEQLYSLTQEFIEAKKRLQEKINQSAFNGTKLFDLHVESLPFWGELAISSETALLDKIQENIFDHGLDADALQIEISTTTVGVGQLNDMLPHKVGQKIYQIWINDDSARAAIYFINSVFDFTPRLMAQMTKEIARTWH